MRYWYFRTHEFWQHLAVFKVRIVAGDPGIESPRRIDLRDRAGWIDPAETGDKVTGGTRGLVHSGRRCVLSGEYKNPRTWSIGMPCGLLFIAVLWLGWPLPPAGFAGDA